MSTGSYQRSWNESGRERPDDWRRRQHRHSRHKQPSVDVERVADHGCGTWTPVSPSSRRVLQDIASILPNSAVDPWWVIGGVSWVSP